MCFWDIVTVARWIVGVRNLVGFFSIVLFSQPHLPEVEIFILLIAGVLLFGVHQQGDHKSYFVVAEPWLQALHAFGGQPREGTGLGRGRTHLE